MEDDERVVVERGGGGLPHEQHCADGRGGGLPVQ